MGKPSIVIRGAREHNLKGIDIEIPRERLTVITGVSGSGKSSLAFDTLFREGQRRFLETLPAFARQFAGRFARPAVASLEGIGPAVAVGQRANLSNPRSTVGTMTEVWDLLRLLYARRGTAPAEVPLSRGLFSFNGPGACPDCQGLGVVDRLDLDLLVADGAKSLRNGALRVSTPNGYLMYSQVTLEVLNDVLKAHGGSVDTPWNALGDELRRVVLYGSERLKVPYGKHPLESRLKWTGITARPRPEGFYRGLVPVMEEILRGKRNDSILRFVRSSPCLACNGTRLGPAARSVRWRGRGIADLAALTAAELGAFLAAPCDDAVEEAIRRDVAERCALMLELGLGYLTFDRAAPTLSMGEGQRLRLLSLATGELRGLVVVLDEPSAGLHPRDVRRLLGVLRRLRDRGQTVVVVEHDACLAREADWLIDLGPGAGDAGGACLWRGSPATLIASDLDTPTARWLRGQEETPLRAAPRGDALQQLDPVTRRNLRDVTIHLRARALNVVSGVSGAGKSTLLAEAVAQLRERALFDRIVMVDASPIGRTPRSNPATYSGAFDLIRDLFAATPEAKMRGLGKGHFTFNTAGGRCEACEGAGITEVGMRHLGSVELVCETCGGRRFQPEVLAVTWNGRTIADMLEGSIDDAAAWFAEHAKLRRILSALSACGLGYLSLGQPATTLSGGEAQRVKLATELAKAGKGRALIALDEPTTGLHAADVTVLLRAWDHLLAADHTLLVVENDPSVVASADHLILLGPESGPEGGRVMAEGLPTDLLPAQHVEKVEPSLPTEGPEPPILLRGVTTHNLQSIDVALPASGLTVVTGPSGSGKSSLVFDTLLAEAQNRFSDLVSPWARRLLPRRGGAELASAHGLPAAVSVPAHAGRRNPRSRVGTVSELDELLRTLFSRAGEPPNASPGALRTALWASAFSPNTEAGACPTCRGLGLLQQCDPDRLVRQPDLPVTGGAMDGTRFGAYLGEADGRFVATWRAVGAALGLEADRPWREMDAESRRIAMRGAGERLFDVTWRYRRGRTEGEHAFTGPWEGFATLVDREHERIHLKTGPETDELEGLLTDQTCPACNGERLKAEARAVRVAGIRLPEVEALTLDALHAWLGAWPPSLDWLAPLRADLLARLTALRDAGLGYLQPNREVATLSGGELQRLRLASALAGGLTGVAYVLDEPTQGLHARDRQRLAGVLRRLADEGNAVIVVEHDAELIRQADHIVELGPGAGPEGGRLVASGSPAELAALSSSRLGALLRRRGAPSAPPFSFSPGLTIRGARAHNLQGIDVTFPAGAVTMVTGVSGSGKTTLVRDVVEASLRANLRGDGVVGCRELQLHVELASVQALGATAGRAGGASTVASLTGMADTLRKRYAATTEAKARKLGPGAFSTATPGGRCEVCEGRGVITVAMDLLPDVAVGCEACQGQRFRPEVLACRVHGLTFAELLDTTLAHAADRFAADRTLAPRLRALCDIGLDYLTLGQEGSALSAGEFQRLRLAERLLEHDGRPAVLLLDEPARGLGYEDVDRLVPALRRLARQGHLVLVVEHNLDLIAAADWVVDLGPDGGPAGGQVIFEGTPAALAAFPASHTGRALAARTE